MRFGVRVNCPMPLETRQKDRLILGHAWPIGREMFESLLGDALPNEQCSLCYLMTTKCYFLPEFRDNGIRPVVALLSIPFLRSSPMAYDVSATLLPITLHVFAVPKEDVEVARNFFQLKVTPRMRVLLQERMSASAKSTTAPIWLGTDKTWTTLHEHFWPSLCVQADRRKRL